MQTHKPPPCVLEASRDSVTFTKGRNDRATYDSNTFHEESDVGWKVHRWTPTAAPINSAARLTFDYVIDYIFHRAVYPAKTRAPVT